MVRLISLWLLLQLCWTWAAESPIFSVLRVRPSSALQLQLLRSLHSRSADLDLDFWQPPSSLGQPVDVMLGPQAAPAFNAALSRANLSATPLIQDVEKLILRKEGSQSSPLRQSPHLPPGRRMYSDAVPRSRRPFNLAQYHSYGDVPNTPFLLYCVNI